MELELLDIFKNEPKNDGITNIFAQELKQNLKQYDINKSEVFKMNDEEIKALSTKYRDIFLAERNKILIEYAKETESEGTMYYIYGTNSQKEKTFNATICEEGKSNEIYELPQEQLPINAEIGCALRKNNDTFYVDENATLFLNEKFRKQILDLLECQNNELQEKRIEGHKYEVSEIGENKVYLFDITEDDSNGLEEIEENQIPEELFNKLKEGSVLVFENGQYNLSE